MNIAIIILCVIILFVLIGIAGSIMNFEKRLNERIEQEKLIYMADRDYLLDRVDELFELVMAESDSVHKHLNLVSSEFSENVDDLENLLIKELNEMN